MTLKRVLIAGLSLIAVTSSAATADEKACKASKARIGECFITHAWANFLPADGVARLFPEPKFQGKYFPGEYYLENYIPKDYHALGSPADLLAEFEVCPVKPSASVAADIARVHNDSALTVCIESIKNAEVIPGDGTDRAPFCKAAPWMCEEKKP